MRQGKSTGSSEPVGLLQWLPTGASVDKWALFLAAAAHLGRRPSCGLFYGLVNTQLPAGAQLALSCLRFHGPLLLLCLGNSQMNQCDFHTMRTTFPRTNHTWATQTPGRTGGVGLELSFLLIFLKFTCSSPEQLLMFNSHVFTFIELLAGAGFLK